MQVQTNIFKIVLVGTGGCGKSAYLRRHLTGDFQNEYIPTLGVEVHLLRFTTNYGPICFNVWDCAGQEQYKGLSDGYYLQAQGAIVMFDLTRKGVQHVNEVARCKEYIRDIQRVVGYENIPIVIAGNKCDLKDRHRMDYHPFRPALYYDISARSNYNFEKPFLVLARALTGHQDLVFVENPAQQPPLVEVNFEAIQKYEAMLLGLNA